MYFLRGFNGNEATLPFCVIPAIATYIDHIKTQVENFRLHLLLMEIYAKLTHRDNIIPIINVMQIVDLLFCDGER